jgi:hypothetical protein
MTLFREPWPDDKEVNGGNAYHCAQLRYPPPEGGGELCKDTSTSVEASTPPPREGGSTLHDPHPET